MVIPNLHFLANSPFLEKPHAAQDEHNKIPCVTGPQAVSEYSFAITATTLATLLDKSPKSFKVTLVTGAREGPCRRDSSIVTLLQAVLQEH